MAGDLVGWGKITPCLQYGDTCRKHRKFFHRQIGTKSSLEAFYLTAEAEAKQFARNILKDPDNLITHCRRCDPDHPPDYGADMLFAEQDSRLGSPEDLSWLYRQG